MEGLLAGLATAATPENLLFCLLGVLVGTLIGVLPGVGPTATISILLPLTIGLSPVTAIIMLAGIYYGASYGGSTTAILVNIPGEAQSVVTCIDGYRMAQRGRAGPALAIAAIGSFVAGTLGAIGIGLVSQPLIAVAIRFGALEYFALMLLGFVVVTALAKGSPLKSIAMIGLGLLFATIGQDVITGQTRFTFGLIDLIDGISTVTLAMGLFGMGEVLWTLRQLDERSVQAARIDRLMPDAEEWRRSVGPMARGSVLGFLIGLLPGGGATLASFMSYVTEKRLSQHPDEFGKGAIEGVAGPEAANNSGTAGSFIPLLTLGLPGNPVTAILMGALILHGVAPGPLLMTNNPEVFWGVVASMYAGNLMLLVLNLPLVGIWVQLLRVPYRVLFGALVLFMVIGAYSLRSNPFDIVLLAAFGVLGYALRRFDFDPAPLVLAFVLGDALEFNLRQAMMLSRGSFDYVWTRPWALAIFAITILVIVLPLLGSVRRALARAREANEPAA
jgi:putative tricarboxylic transport membrane protein